MSLSSVPLRAAEAGQRRTWNLALAFQEVFTAVVRLRFGQQAVANADQFRLHIKQALQLAQGDARANGYGAEDLNMATFAVVAFVDESILNSRNPVFADWPRMPLQEELYGGHVAGELFFRNLQTVLERIDSGSTADLLEVYYLCLLLGYTGRYGAGNAGELPGITAAIRDKLHRVRGDAMVFSPRCEIPVEAAPAPRQDPWLRRLAIAAIAAFVAAALLFGGMKLALMSGVSESHAIATQTRS
jgi:type VI secretion system protein ImpK